MDLRQAALPRQHGAALGLGWLAPNAPRELFKGRPTSVSVEGLGEGSRQSHGQSHQGGGSTWLWPVAGIAAMAAFTGKRPRRCARSAQQGRNASKACRVVALHAEVESRTRTVNPADNLPELQREWEKPESIENSQNYKDMAAFSKKFTNLGANGQITPKRVAIIGGGLSGLACAKYLADAGHTPIVLEARDCLGGKVSAWQDKDGDWIETGLHIIFGAYPNMMNLFAELGIEYRAQWKRHQMIFAMEQLPGEFTTFDFLKGLPAPFNFALAILLNQKMLTLPEKLQTAPPLVPMLLEGQSFIDQQDDLSVTEFMRKYGMPERINQEVFIPMAKALDFIDPDKLSMTVILTAMNRFLNETDGLQMAFLDGNYPERLCAPMVEYIEERGGEVRLSKPLDRIVVDEDSSVKHLLLRDGSIIEADEYISAVPCDIMKRIVPKEWAHMPFFRQVDELEGIPVINIHLWFDRKLKNVDHLCFSRSPLLSVYADMSTTCRESRDDKRSMLELVFAPCSPLAGGKIDWMQRTDEEIISETMRELERIFPTEIGAGCPDGGAQLRKSAVVKTPRSVYAAIPGRNRYRPSQDTPISNFTLAGDWTSQKFLGSMEGAIFAGKLAAEVVCDRAAGVPTKGLKAVDPRIVELAKDHVPTEPVGVHGNSAIAFGGGAVIGSKPERELVDELMTAVTK